MVTYSEIAGWTLLIMMVGVSIAIVAWVKHERQRWGAAIKDPGSWAGWIIVIGFNFLGYMFGFKLSGLL